MLNREDALAEINVQVRRCDKCQLYIGRTRAVPGDGPVNAEIMFIGEAPGFHEDQQGIPFVGAAGRLLNELLEKANIDRNTVYITNVIKCRPPGNRVPAKPEMEVCSPYLEAQIALIQPALIVTLGNTSTQWLLPEVPGITKSHGTFYTWRGRILLYPMFHPSYLLRNPSRAKGSPKYQTWEDIKKVRKWLDEYTGA